MPNTNWVIIGRAAIAAITIAAVIGSAGHVALAQADQGQMQQALNAVGNCLVYEVGVLYTQPETATAVATAALAACRPVLLTVDAPNVADEVIARLLPSITSRVMHIRAAAAAGLLR